MEEAKDTILACGYLCALDTSEPPELHALQGQMTLVYEKLAEQNPERLAVVRTWNTNRPHVTLGSYMFMDYEAEPGQHGAGCRQVRHVPRGRRTCHD